MSSPPGSNDPEPFEQSIGQTVVRVSSMRIGGRSPRLIFWPLNRSKPCDGVGCFGQAVTFAEEDRRVLQTLANDTIDFVPRQRQRIPHARESEISSPDADAVGSHRSRRADRCLVALARQPTRPRR
jgi:hypothetical protein